MLRLSERETEIELPVVREWHPHPRQLERFMRSELPRAEVASIVRHLLKGCPQCVQVTRRLWSLGDGV